MLRNVFILFYNKINKFNDFWERKFKWYFGKWSYIVLDKKYSIFAYFNIFLTSVELKNMINTIIKRIIYIILIYYSY